MLRVIGNYTCGPDATLNLNKEVCVCSIWFPEHLLKLLQMTLTFLDWILENTDRDIRNKITYSQTKKRILYATNQV